MHTIGVVKSWTLPGLSVVEAKLSVHPRTLRPWKTLFDQVTSPRSVERMPNGGQGSRRKFRKWPLRSNGTRPPGRHRNRLLYTSKGSIAVPSHLLVVSSARLSRSRGMQSGLHNTIVPQRQNNVRKVGWTVVDSNTPVICGRGKRYLNTRPSFGTVDQPVTLCTAPTESCHQRLNLRSIKNL